MANSLGNGNNIVGQKLTYTCNTGYEFKDVVPAGASSQGLFPIKFQILNVLLKVKILKLFHFRYCAYKCNQGNLY